VREAPPREQRRESRLAKGISLARIRDVVCRVYDLEFSELKRRGSRQEARAAFAFLARRHTVATHAELARVLGVSRPDSVPNFTRRFSNWLRERREVRRRLQALEEQLEPDPPTE
jgi:hypothetical protein